MVFNETARTKTKTLPKRGPQCPKINPSWDHFGAMLGPKRGKQEFETESASKRKKKREPESEMTGLGAP